MDWLARLMPGERRPEPLPSQAKVCAARNRTEEALARAQSRLDGLWALLETGDVRDAGLLATLLAEDLDAAARELGLPETAGPQREALGLLPEAKALVAFARQAEARHDAAARRLAERKAADWAIPNDRYQRRALWRARALLCVVVALLAGGILLSDAVAKKRREFAAGLALERQRRQTAADLAELADLARRAKQAARLPLPVITGRNCSRCGCEDRDLRHAPDGDVCVRQWEASLAGLVRAAGAPPEIQGRLARDPWGSPYLLNENEKEQRGACVKDEIASAGPNGQAGDGDDLTQSVDNVFCPN